MPLSRAGQTLGGLTASGGFHFTETQGGSIPYLYRWEPSTSPLPIFEGYPASAPSSLSAPSAVMYGNRVMFVGGNELHERFMWGNTKWHTFGRAFGNNPLRDVPPCVLSDGHVFVTTLGGEVAQLWWNAANSTWNWASHGYPKKADFFGNNGVKAIVVGGAMPSSSKVFVTCDDGSLRQIYWNGNGWTWHNHGLPFGWRADTKAVAVNDGKVFVTGSWNNLRMLFQLYWNGSTWVWYAHGNPGTSIAGGAEAALGGDNVAVKGADGNFYMTYWAGSSWAWRSLGKP